MKVMGTAPPQGTTTTHWPSSPCDHIASQSSKPLGPRPMTFALAKGQICLAEWVAPLTVEHVVSLLIDLRQARQGRRAPPLLLLAVHRAVFAGPGPFDIIPTALPALLDGCCNVFVILEPEDPQARTIRALFSVATRTSTRSGPQIFFSLDEALVGAQAVAPHDALEVQRQNLRRRFRT